MTALDDLTAMWGELVQTTKGYRQMAQPLVPGTHWYNAQQLYTKLQAELQPAPPQPPPPPPPQSGALDDMRATHMTAISSHMVAISGTDSVVNPDGTPMGAGWTISRSQSPAGFWDSLNYRNDDITLIADARFGQVYRVRTNGQSSSPYWGSPTTCDAELVKYKPVTLGQFDWYALALKWELGWNYVNVTDWHALFQFSYPTISSPPVGLFAGYGDHIFLSRQAGLVTNGTAAEIDYYGLPLYAVGPFRQVSILAGHWYDCIVGVKWGANNDGEIHFLDRVKDFGESTFLEHVAVTGVTTWQWGGALNIPQNPVAFQVDDKLDSYWGYKAGLTDANITTDYFLQHTGHVRCATKADAMAYLP